MGQFKSSWRNQICWGKWPHICWKLQYIYFQQSPPSDLQHTGCIYLEAGPGLQTQKETELITPLLSSDPSFVMFLSTNIHTNLHYHPAGNLEVSGDSFTAYLSFSYWPLPPLPSVSLITSLYFMVFPGGASGKESPCQCRRLKGRGFNPWVREIL